MPPLAKNLVTLAVIAPTLSTQVKLFEGLIGGPLVMFQRLLAHFRAQLTRPRVSNGPRGTYRLPDAR